MPSLLDTIDRFSYTAQSIQSSCRQVKINPVGPYVRAVLHTKLGDKARDIDASELGLFTLVTPPSAHGTTTDEPDAAAVAKTEVARIELPSATPLRKPAGGVRGLNSRQDEKEPEVYAEAAIKYLDKYHSIWSMPRARQEAIAIIEKLNQLRDDIDRLSEIVQECEQPDANPKATVKDEERRIQELNLRIKQLKARKEVLVKKQGLSAKTTSATSTAHAEDSQEDEFWSKPAPQASGFKTNARRSLVIPTGDDDGEGDESLLLDAKMDVDMGAMIGDISMDSISDAPTPLPAPRPPSTAKKAVSASRPTKTEDRPDMDPTVVEKVPGAKISSRKSLSRAALLRDTEPMPVPEPEDHEEYQDEEEDEEAEEEKTVVLSRPPVSVHTGQPSRSPSPPSSPEVRQTSPARTEMPTPPSEIKLDENNHPRGAGVVPATPARTPGKDAPVTPGTAGRSRPRITTEIERIITKIWSTVGDIIMPGHPFNTASAASTNKPPRAKETIALLQNISSQQPQPASPSTHSTLSLTTHDRDASHGQPNAHQILTATLLLALLSAPEQALPLAKAKEALAARGLGAPAPAASSGLSGLGIGLGLGGGQGLESRALYGCVAKRLLKIDRGAREQIVKFNV